MFCCYHQNIWQQFKLNTLCYNNSRQITIASRKQKPVNTGVPQGSTVCPTLPLMTSGMVHAGPSASLQTQNQEEWLASQSCAQRGTEVSILTDTQNPNGHSPGQPVPADSVLCSPILLLNLYIHYFMEKCYKPKKNMKTSFPDLLQQYFNNY